MGWRPAFSPAGGWIAALWAGLCLVIPGPLAAQASLEAPVKATFLYRFADFVRWPPGVFESPVDPVRICLVGEDAFGVVLDQALAGQTAAGRPLAVHRLEALQAQSPCHIAYIAGSAAQSVEEALDSVHTAPMLTVTDEDNGAARGVVHFELANNRVRFHIDERAASQNGLTINSRLLDIALTVQRRAP